MVIVLLDIIKVDIPKHKVFIAPSGINKIKYVYYILKSYRNKKGQPTGKTVSIGKYDEDTNKLIPNNNFFKYYDCDIKVLVKGEKKS